MCIRDRYELVSVGRDAFLHGQIRYVDVQRATAYPVHHFDAERRKRTLVVRFYVEFQVMMQQLVYILLS